MPYSFKIQAAGLCAVVTAEYPASKNLLREYLLPADTPADLEIVIGREALDHEKEIYLRCCELDGVKPESFDEKYFEFCAIFREIAEQLPFYDGFAFHGSVVGVDGNAYLFAARSGVGKSTHTALWRRYFGDRAIMVNDDKPFLRIQENTLYAYGSPWNGKHGLSAPCRKPLKAICLLERSAENHISEITLPEISAMLVQQSLRPRRADALIRLMQLLDGLGNYVKFYRMGCNMDISAAKMAYEFMSKRI